MSATQIKEVRPWHEAMVDFELKNPGASGADLAAFFDKSQAWISIVKRTDAYVEYRTKRIGDHQTRLSSTTVEKLEALADITVDEMLEKVEKEREKLSLADVGACAQLALKALGYGQGKNNTSNTQVNIYGQPSKADFTRAKRLYEQAHAGGDKVIDEAGEVLPALPAT